MAAPRVIATCVVVLALVAAACRGTIARDDAGARLATPYPIGAFQAVDLDGRDRSPETWKGQVVVVNVWATWCGPCRREIPALAALQAKYARKLLVIGLIQDNVTAEFARAFGTSTGINYPIVASTFEIESRFPKILALPTTFVVDDRGRLVAMYVGEIDPAQLDREVLRLLGPDPARGG